MAGGGGIERSFSTRLGLAAPRLTLPLISFNFRKAISYFAFLQAGRYMRTADRAKVSLKKFQVE